MLLSDKINEYIGESMKAGDTKKTETLRLIKSAFLNYTKQEIKELLKTEKFAARTQGYCYMWSVN